jgi:hypothetical protein
VLTDSAGIVAPTEPQWINAMHHLGDLEESLGLPGDALLAHEAVKQRKPDEMKSALRAYWLRALLYDPVNPDTSAFDRRMREMHLR